MPISVVTSSFSKQSGKEYENEDHLYKNRMTISQFVLSVCHSRLAIDDYIGEG